ncbi:MAG: TonB family protein [Bacteroidota bacterium]|jgi:protein TonB
MAETSIFDNSWVDMVFEGRNQQYGAFVLRKKSSNYTLKGIIFSIIGFSLAIAAPVIVNYLKSQIPKENIIVEAEVTKLDAPPPIDESTPPPPPPPPPPPVKSTIKFTPPEIKKDEDVAEPPPTQDEAAKVDVGAQTVIGDPDAKEVLVEETGNGDGEILIEAEINPEYPGGEEKMQEYLSSAVEYPPMAKENNIEGRVVLRFAVMADGKIDNIQILNKPALGWGCEAAVEKAVKSMPRWSPGKQQGRPVAVYFTLPFQFKLDQ